MTIKGLKHSVSGPLSTTLVSQIVIQCTIHHASIKKRTKQAQPLDLRLGSTAEVFPVKKSRRNGVGRKGPWSKFMNGDSFQISSMV